MSNDNYRELLEEARDALRNVLKASEPGTGLALHSAYNTLKQSIQKEEEAIAGAERAAGTRDPWAERAEQRAEQGDRWAELSIPERHRLTLELLGEDQLTAREVRDRLRGELGESAVYDGDIRNELKRLIDAGELQRKLEPNTRGRTRYRYFRNTHLSGPIVDLERTFHEPTEQEDV